MVSMAEVNIMVVQRRDVRCKQCGHRFGIHSYGINHQCLTERCICSSFKGNVSLYPIYQEYFLREADG